MAEEKLPELRKSNAASTLAAAAAMEKNALGEEAAAHKDVEEAMVEGRVAESPASWTSPRLRALIEPPPPRVPKPQPPPEPKAKK